jgi:hypothetical protein
MQRDLAPQRPQCRLSLRERSVEQVSNLLYFFAIAFLPGLCQESGAPGPSRLCLDPY